MTVAYTYGAAANGGPIPTWVVPDNIVGDITLTLHGAGGADCAGATGGEGGRVVGTVTPNPGDQWFLYVGGGGGKPSGDFPGFGGYNGGGDGGPAYYVNSTTHGYFSSGGGGGTDVRVNSQALGARLAVAGGGGGAGNGASGPTNGGNGGPATGQSGSGVAAGHGGSQSVGGSGGNPAGAASTSGHDGTLGFGGQGASCAGSNNVNYASGAGGGGGYYGGGGGGAADGGHSGGGAGGGSNYTGGLLVTTANLNGGGSGQGSGGYGLDGFIEIAFAVAPNAPNNVSPNGGQVNGLAAVPVYWTYSSLDNADPQAHADLRWRVGSGAWTYLIGAATTAHSASFASGTFSGVLGQVVEFQVRVASAASGSTYSPWSSSGYFTPVNPPPAGFTFSPAPTITSQTPEVKGSRADSGPLSGCQVQVTDASSNVLVDTGEIVFSTVQYAVDVTLPAYAYTNGAAYHILTRIEYPRGVWSSYADSGPLTASINAPLSPTVVLTPIVDSAMVQVAITNPSGGAIAPDHNDVYRTNMVTGVETRIATGVPLNGTYIDATVGFNRQYRYRVVAVSSSGAGSSSS